MNKNSAHAATLALRWLHPWDARGPNRYPGFERGSLRVFSRPYTRRSLHYWRDGKRTPSEAVLVDLKTALEARLGVGNVALQAVDDLLAWERSRLKRRTGYRPKG